MKIQHITPTYIQPLQLSFSEKFNNGKTIHELAERVRKYGWGKTDFDTEIPYVAAYPVPKDKQFQNKRYMLIDGLRREMAALEAHVKLPACIFLPNEKIDFGKYHVHISFDENGEVLYQHCLEMYETIKFFSELKV